jgi:hypothetical protein
MGWRTALTRVWQLKWTILFWAVLLYLVGLAIVLVVGTVRDVIVDTPPTIIREGPGTPTP